MTVPTRAVVGLLGAAALWGVMFVGIHQVLRELDPVQVVTLRFLLVTPVFGLLLVLSRRLWPRVARRDAGLLLLAGVAAVPGAQLALVEGQRFLSPPSASLIATLAPALTAVLAALVLREPMARRQVSGFVVAIGGAAMIVLLGDGGGSLEASDPARASLALLSPLSWAIYTLLLSRLSTRHSGLGVTAVAVLAGTALMLPFLPHAAAGLDGLSGETWLWLLILSLVGTGGTYLLWSLSVPLVPVNRAAAFMYLVPVFALGWSAALVGILPTVAALAGGVLVLGGVVLTQSTSR